MGSTVSMSIPVSIARRSTLAAMRCLGRSSISSGAFHHSRTSAIYGTSETLKVDGEGRVILSENLKIHAGIGDTVAFVGLGHKFQIWEPERFRAQLAEATEKVRALKKQLGSRIAAGESLGARE
jgi:DNA-binding transcriptional regulator/RsmH inhibitor MraZ